MNPRRTRVIVLGAFLVIFLVSPLKSQMISICKFEGVNIPYNLKHDDATIEKGKYDIEIFISDVRSGKLFYLRINKEKKSLCMLTGEELEYDKTMPKELLSDPNIPDDPILRMKRHPITKMFYFIYESGKKNWMYPLRKMRFKIQSED